MPMKSDNSKFPDDSVPLDTEDIQPRNRRALSFDVDRYQAYLDGSDLTDAQKRAFAETLWKIMVSFVDLGFHIHPLQQVDESCGQLLDTTANPDRSLMSAINSDNKHKKGEAQ